jgi:hypothetical protein
VGLGRDGFEDLAILVCTILLAWIGKVQLREHVFTVATLLHCSTVHSPFTDTQDYNQPKTRIWGIRMSG